MRLIVTKGEFIEVVDNEIVMTKTKVKVYREVLTDVSQKFEGAGNFIKQRIEEICEQKKITAKEVFYFCIFLIISIFL